jgi:radical SAM-linked protein
MRIRATFSKRGALIYIGNLDLLTIWERAARRAGLALAYSKGFHPQPKIQAAAPLPLGFSSRCEVLDMRLEEDVDCEAAATALQSMLPDGIQILRLESVDASLPPLQTLVESADYEVSIAGGAKGIDLIQGVRDIAAAKSIWRTRRGKSYDLRPLIEKIEAAGDPASGETTLRMRLRAREGATGRPDEVLEALGVERDAAKIERTALIFGPRG